MNQAIALRAIAHGFLPQPPKAQYARLEGNDAAKVRELAWSFIIQGIMVPGLNELNPNLPFFSLTEYGQIVVSSKDPTPHDPDQYLEHIKLLAPNLDAIAIAYIQEGLDCFQRGTYTASVVMLGVAVEKLTLDLAEAVQGSLPSSEANNLSTAIKQARIATIYDETMKRLMHRAKNLPQDINDGLKGQLDGVFSIIRTHRNEAGHPSGQMMDRLTALGLFSSFPFYCKRVCRLIEHIRKNRLPV